jgi:cell wall assembly regulator SMI1
MTNRSAPEVDRSVRTLEAWLAARAPALATALAAPAAPADIAHVEAIVGSALPADYRAFLALHDGQRFVAGEDHQGTLAPLFSGLDLLPLRIAADEYETITEEWGDEGPGEIQAIGPVRPLHKHTRWWPVTCVFGSSQYHCLDLDPAPGGAVGQVIFIADDDERRRVVAPSFAAFLEMLAGALSLPGVAPSDEGIDLPDDVFDTLIGASDD